MKKHYPISFLGLALAFFFSLGICAQETTEVTLKVKKDGKVVKDTTYQFDDAAEAEHAIKMMEILSGDENKMMKYHYNTDADTDFHSNTMVFISKDGEKTELREFHGDSLMWISEEEHGSDHVKVIKRKMKDGEHMHHGEHLHHGEHINGEKVIIIKSDDGETVELLMDVDEDGTWHVDSKDLKDVDEDVYVISVDDGKGELIEIIENSDENEDGDMKVIVVKTK